MIEHMFDAEIASIGLPAGEAELSSGWCDESDELGLLVTVDEWNQDRAEDDRHFLPDLEAVSPGWFLQAILDRSTVNV